MGRISSNKSCKKEKKKRFPPVKLEIRCNGVDHQRSAGAEEKQTFTHDADAAQSCQTRDWVLRWLRVESSRVEFKVGPGGAEQEPRSTLPAVSSCVRGAHFLLICCHQRSGSPVSWQSHKFRLRPDSPPTPMVGCVPSAFTFSGKCFGFFFLFNLFPYI